MSGKRERAPEMSVGEVRGILARMLGIERRHVGHYAICVTTVRGLEVRFCCDDRLATAGLLRDGARRLLSDPGVSSTSRPPPPMPES